MRPRYVSGELRCSFVSGNSRKSARFVILRVEAPPLNHEPTEKCRRFQGPFGTPMHGPYHRSAWSLSSQRVAATFRIRPTQSKIKQQTQGFRTFDSGGWGVFCQFQREEAQKLRSFRSLIYKPQEHPRGGAPVAMAVVLSSRPRWER